MACQELESFYLGDLAAVECGLDIRNLKTKQQQKKFRNPDKLGNPSLELKNITGNRYNKIAGSRAIAPYLNTKNNCSGSFNVLVSGILKMMAG